MTDEKDALIADLEAENARLRGLRVKPLEWFLAQINYHRADPMNCAFRYTVREDVNAQGSFYWYINGSKNDSPFLSLEAAKAGAQADYERRVLSALAPASEPADDVREPITMRYTNWRGETAMRTIRPLRLRYDATEWHPEPGWLLTAWDTEKDAERDFALSDCDFTAALAAMPPREVSVAEAARVLLDATPNPIFGNLKPVLMDEFSETHPFINDDGDEDTLDVTISWWATKDIIEAALRALAAKGGEA